MTVVLTKPRFTAVSLHKPKRRKVVIHPVDNAAQCASGKPSKLSCDMATLLDDDWCPRHAPLGYAAWGSKHRAVTR